MLKSAFRFLFVFIAVISASAQTPQNKSSADIVINNFVGNLVRSNANGGFIIDRISGNAELNANGSIKIGMIDGNLTAITAAGDIEIREARGDVIARAQAGNISIEKALQGVYAQAEMGEIRIRSAGSVEIQNIFGGDVKLANPSGTSKVLTKGNILLVVTKISSLPEICNLASAEGDITIYLPENVSADLEIRTPLSEDPKRESRIESEFKFGKFKQKCGIGNIISFSTKINEGGGKINLYIEKGNIFIKTIKPGQKIPFFGPEL